jgi:aryl-alcohol dehydrogenase-like predicted oxidoreductase
MRTRRIGARQASEIGLGACHLSLKGRPDEDTAVRTIHASLDAGVTLIDTADAYSLTADDFGHNETLVAAALASAGRRADGVLVATKGGHTRPNRTDWGLDGSPAHLRAACEASLRRLGVEAIDLYHLHWPDPHYPFEETVGGLRDLADAGLVRMIGISNVSVQQIETARETLGERLVSVQNEMSLWNRKSMDQLRLCETLGLAFLAYMPLGGVKPSTMVDRGDPVLGRIAQRHGVSVFRVALAWLLSLSPVMIPIPGARRPETARDSAAASGLVLDPREIVELTAKTGTAPGSA